MIAQGSSELNISFVVKREDGPKAVKALHREFKLGEVS
jgi:aspartate kinase